MSTQRLVEAIKRHALTQDGGWRVVAEQLSDDQIREVIGTARTVSASIAKFTPLVGVWSTWQADVRKEQSMKFEIVKNTVLRAGDHPDRAYMAIIKDNQGRVIRTSPMVSESEANEWLEHYRRRFG